MYLMSHKIRYIDVPYFMTHIYNMSHKIRYIDVSYFMTHIV